MNEYNDNNYQIPNASEGEGAYVYTQAPNLNNSNPSRAWSVAALVLGIMSIICCCSYIITAVMVVMAIVCAIISRKNLGYFDGLSIAGLITAIFGFVIFASSLVVDMLFADEIARYMEEYMHEYMKMLEEMGYQP
jgi:hypothetical protein